MDTCEELIKSALGEIERVLSTKTVVGEPMPVDGNTIIPLISIGFGFGAGSSGTKKEKGEEGGSGAGGGGGIRPVAIIIVNKDGVRIEGVRGGTSSMLERAGESIGRILERRWEKKEGKGTTGL
ncbi:MAG: sporulation protein YtfJ [Dehalococcoidia bacterium]|nr:sporulation protein YtfJ [Dehalococcoidia bacterium]